MRIEDLRIGNLVWTDIDLLSYNVHTVVAGDFGDYHNKKLKPEMLIPIPLNEEWLLRIDWNGFNYLHINSYFSLDKYCHLYYHGDYTGINIDYVHSLQNLYHDLTGQELEIK